MKVLLLSLGTGGGHDSAARAIMEKLSEYNIETEMINSYSLRSQRIAKKIDRSYLNMIAKRPRFFKKLYKICELYSNSKIKSPVYGLNTLFGKTLRQYIEENNFDLVIATHLFCAQTLSSIKKKNHNIKFLFVNTDYVCYPFSVEINPDYYIIPSKYLINLFIKKKIKKEKLLPFGIPVSPKFNIKYSKERARDLLGLPQNKKIVLLIGGSMGFGNLEDAIEEIQDEYDNKVYIVTICGYNKELKHNLEKEFDNIEVVGFTKEMSIYLDACDVVLTKPGGLTSTEIAVKNTPVIFTDPIPGIEDKNAEFFENYNMAYVCKNNKHLIKYLDKLLFNDRAIYKMKKSQSNFINKNSTNDLVRFIIKNYMK